EPETDGEAPADAVGRRRRGRAALFDAPEDQEAGVAGADGLDAGPAYSRRRHKGGEGGKDEEETLDVAGSAGRESLAPRGSKRSKRKAKGAIVLALPPKVADDASSTTLTSPSLADSGAICASFDHVKPEPALLSDASPIKPADLALPTISSTDTLVVPDAEPAIVAEADSTVVAVPDGASLSASDVAEPLPLSSPAPAAEADDHGSDDDSDASSIASNDSFDRMDLRQGGEGSSSDAPSHFIVDVEAGAGKGGKKKKGRKDGKLRGWISGLLGHKGEKKDAPAITIMEADPSQQLVPDVSTDGSRRSPSPEADFIAQQAADADWDAYPVERPEMYILNGSARFPLDIEKAIYRHSHGKLAQHRRPLHEQ
ncbi:hypothetical protein BDK51DRAFT_49417, partial [Blyttiomyces helicus]